MTINSKYILPILLACGFAWGQTAVTPVVQPHQTFFDLSGDPCALCTMATYAAGTTIPLATYTDSSGVTSNPNPIILSVSGGATIWLSQTASYKFVLKDTLGSTVFTVDNVKSATGSLPCITPYTVQFANSGGTALACDSQISINPTSHALQIGGTISGNSFTLRNLSTIPASWTLDVTSPLAALVSLSPIPLTDLATQASNTVLMNNTNAAAVPTPVSLPSGCGVLGISYDTTAHTWSCVVGATQAADTVNMNASGITAAPTAVTLPGGCINGVNYSTSTHSWTCVTQVANIFVLTGTNTCGVAYQNNRGYAITVHIVHEVGGMSGATLTATEGPTSSSMVMGPSVSAVSAFGGSASAELTMTVPTSWFYQVSRDTGGCGVIYWDEAPIQ